MSILAQFTNEYFDEPVEVLDVWDTPSGKYASVKAITGRPFVGGDHWAVHTEFKTVPVCKLKDINQDTQPEPITTQKSMLDLAIEQERAQWHAGESVWLWKGKRSGAFLKNNGQGQVILRLTDRQPGCLIFFLGADGWKVNHTVHTDYLRWIEAVR